MSLMKTGLDIGSTTAKIVVVNDTGQLAFFRYIQHHADVSSVLLSLLHDISPYAGTDPVVFTLTGSVGLGMAEKYSLPFVQEVVAATRCVETLYSQVSTLIDMGGEDAKIVYFREASAFCYFTPFTDIFEEAYHAREVVSLSAQLREGWLLPGEMISCARAEITT